MQAVDDRRHHQLARRPGELMVDRAQLLVALPGHQHLIVRVTGGQIPRQAGGSPSGVAPWTRFPLAALRHTAWVDCTAGQVKGPPVDGGLTSPLW